MYGGRTATKCGQVSEWEQACCPVPSPMAVCACVCMCTAQGSPSLLHWGRAQDSMRNKMTHCKGHSRTAPPGTCRFQDRGQERRQSRPPPHTGFGYYTYRQRREKELRIMDSDSEGPRVRGQTCSKWEGATECGDWSALLLPAYFLSHRSLQPQGRSSL